MINFQFSTIRYTFEAVNEFETPYFFGSTFRGILGRKLRKMVCIKPFEECKKCEFINTCPYTVIFETEHLLNKPSKYIMKPPFEKKKLKSGDKLFLEMTLLGDTANYWEFITGAYSGVHHIGKDRYIKLKSIEFLHPFESKYYPVKSFVPRFEAVNFFELRTGKETINIRVYPSNIKANNQIIKFSNFNKDVLIKAIISRITNVAVNYGIKNEKIYINKDKFEIADMHLKPSPLKRWSNRKKRHMLIPAFEGSFSLKGDLSEIYPYLNVIETINIGKSVSFGLGKIRLK